MSDPSLWKTGTKCGLSQRGCYTLVISLGKRKKIRVGKLGRACFPEGTYLYTGSAMNGLRARLLRHLRRKNKKSYWHIDYLLKSPEAKIDKILIYRGPTQQECRLNQRITRLPRASVIVKGFGASDCRSSCNTHLVYLGKKFSATHGRRSINARV